MWGAHSRNLLVHLRENAKSLRTRAIVRGRRLIVEPRTVCITLVLATKRVSPAMAASAAQEEQRRCQVAAKACEELTSRYGAGQAHFAAQGGDPLADSG